MLCESSLCVEKRSVPGSPDQPGFPLHSRAADKATVVGTRGRPKDGWRPVGPSGRPVTGLGSTFFRTRPVPTRSAEARPTLSRAAPPRPEDPSGDWVEGDKETSDRQLPSTRGFRGSQGCRGRHKSHRGPGGQETRTSRRAHKDRSAPSALKAMQRKGRKGRKCPNSSTKKAFLQ